MKRLDILMDVELARDFDANALRQIADLADAHARTLSRYATTQKERDAVGTFKDLARASYEMISLQRG